MNSTIITHFDKNNEYSVKFINGNVDEKFRFRNDIQ